MTSSNDRKVYIIVSSTSAETLLEKLKELDPAVVMMEASQPAGVMDSAEKMKTNVDAVVGVVEKDVQVSVSRPGSVLDEAPRPRARRHTTMPGGFHRARIVDDFDTETTDSRKARRDAFYARFPVVDQASWMPGGGFMD